MFSKGSPADYIIPLTALFSGALIAYLTQDIGDMVFVFFLSCVWMELYFIRHYLRNISSYVKGRDFERVEGENRKNG